MSISTGIEHAASLEVLSVDMFPEAAALAAHTMRDNFSYNEVFRGEEGWREQQARDLFQRWMTVKWMSSPNTVRGGRGPDGKLVCTFLFAPSTDPQPSLWSKIQCGLLLIPFYSGLGPFQRMLQSDDWHTMHMKEIIGDRPHFVVNIMAVGEDQQGKGYGSLYLRQALKEADEAGYATILGTNKEINVRFYTRL
jgi:GNAT superfamily N-acetyltransferase